MNPDPDAVAAALERQAAELARSLARLRRARHNLVPEPAAEWRGPARVAFDAAVLAVAQGLDATIAALRQAHDLTLLALGRLRSDG